GATYNGGRSNAGTVFKMTADGLLTTLVQFSGNGATNKGMFPQGRLVEDSDEKFYGTTQSGGASSLGTVFRMTPAGVLATLVKFDDATNKGKFPEGALVEDSVGNFYGTTPEGGADGSGTVFRISSAGVLATLVEFTGNGAANKGSGPSAN